MANGRKIWLILAAVGVTLGQPAWAGPRCPEPLRAMTFNIRLDTAADGVNSWPHRRDFLAGQIAVIDPSILSLQEVLAGQKRDLEADLPQYLFLGVGRDDGAAAGEFSPLAVSRRNFHVRSSGTFWLSPTPSQPSLGWGANYRRIVTWAHLRRRSDGLRVLALSTHWDHQSELARLESARLIRQWIAANRAKAEHVIVMGDFNAGPQSQELRELGGPEGLLHDAAAAPRIGASGSFNAFQAQPVQPPLIDHIFSTAGLHARRHAVLSWTADGRVASDHFAVLADLQPAGATCNR